VAKRSKAIGKLGAAEQAQRPINFHFVVFIGVRVCQALEQTRLLQDLSATVDTCSGQPSNHVFHTNRFARSTITLAAARKSVAERKQM
jgi:hypothetical protein